jgi:hypothetical protein
MHYWYSHLFKDKDYYTTAFNERFINNPYYKEKGEKEYGIN